MKPDAVKSWLEYSTGHKIDKQTLIYWEKEGLLGEVPRIEVKHKKETTKLSEPRRDYSPKNMARVLLTIVLRNAGWKLSDIKKAFEKDVKLSEELNTTLNKIKSGLIQAIENARGVL